ncbi:hypothetical protein EsH8_I_000846 [Colletotrichum jinshuiense]
MSNPPATEPTPQADIAPSTTSDPMAPAAPAVAATDAATADVAMTDAVEPSSSPAPIPQVVPSAPSPAPARTGTPSRNLNNGEASSRAGSVHPDANPAGFPAQAVAHGDSARMFINNNVTAALLEGVKIIGKNQPPNPLKVLGDFLLQKSRERGEPTS